MRNADGDMGEDGRGDGREWGEVEMQLRKGVDEHCMRLEN